MIITHILGKMLLGCLFLVSGLQMATTNTTHIFDIAKALDAKHIPMAFILVILAVALKILAGSILVFSTDKKWIRLSAFALIVFTILATALFHNPLSNSAELIYMLQNFAIVGGLLLLMEY